MNCSALLVLCFSVDVISADEYIVANSRHHVNYFIAIYHLSYPHPVDITDTLLYYIVMEYKQVRITSEYLEKLRKMAIKQKRSMAKMLEVLIDGAN